MADTANSQTAAEWLLELAARFDHDSGSIDPIGIACLRYLADKGLPVLELARQRLDWLADEITDIKLMGIAWDDLEEEFDTLLVATNQWYPPDWQLKYDVSWQETDNG